MVRGAEPEQPTRGTSAPLIGVFDSGVGGLSVVQALRRRVPDAPVVYLADTRHAPYGQLAAATLRERSTTVATVLRERGANALVIACNTATAVAADDLRHRWPDMPIIGMEPAVKPAIQATRTGTVAVFATDGTLASQRFAGLLARYTGKARILVEPCGDLVAFAEAGEWEGAAVRSAAERHLETVIAAGADTVVLGCTHFPLLRGLLDRLAGDRVQLIDTGDAVARQIIRRTGLQPVRVKTPPQPAPMELLTTGDPVHLTAIAERLFERTRPASAVRTVDPPAPPQPADDGPDGLS